jgi:UDP-N-acetylmuramate dehydrogenase
MRPTPKASSHSPSATSSLPALRERTTLRLGGAPRRWYTVHTLAELRGALEQNTEGELLIIGGGSNLVCSDEPFPGSVIEVALSGVSVSTMAPSALEVRSLVAPNATLTSDEIPVELPADTRHVWIHVAAGERWDDVVNSACRWGLGGIECLSGIPGNAGATPIQNVGAYGQEIADTLWSVICMERATGTLISFAAANCDLSYRNSRFKSQDLNKYVVVEIVLRLEVGATGTVRYAELARLLSQDTQPASLARVREVVLTTRAAKSMLFDPADPNGRSCGSFFVNPIVQRQALVGLQRVVGEPVPHYEVDSERVKVPAAWLIERAGFTRGYRRGNVGLSTKHTLCLVAHDNATATELLSLAHQIRDTVKAKFEVDLQPEPVLVGLAW